MPRHFRSDESYDAERTTRNALAAFLRVRGITGIRDARKAYGKNQWQIIHARDSVNRSILGSNLLA
jgi:hypothetical protein